MREIAAAYGRHADSQHAAAIAYRVLFSVVPFVAALVATLDLVLPAGARQRFVDWLFGEIPGTAVESGVDQTLASSGASAPVVGLVAIGVLLWAATGMMASIRVAFRMIWEVPGQPYVRGKLRDLASIGVAGALVVAAFCLSLVAQVVVQTGVGVFDALGWSSAAGTAETLVQLGSSVVVVVAGLLLLYGLVPPVPTRLADVWPSAVVGAIALQLAMGGYAYYLAQVADFDSVYGPLGAVFAFLFLVYVLVVIVLLGAELAVATGRRRTERR